MSDDDDYMSDKFLQSLEKDKAPSLIFKQSDKRKIELTKKRELENKLRQEKKNIHLIEEEKREEGLSSAISSSNKGFALLMKMGYKPGQGIGKEESGIVEPLSVNLKSDRSGLGKLPKKNTQKKRNLESRLENFDADYFRSRVAQKKLEQTLKADLYKSQKVCHQLDVQNKIEKPYEVWYWPPVEPTKETDDETSSEDEDVIDESITDNEKLEYITKYLREKYYYCIWCGTAFDDYDDLRDSCPGSTRNDH